ncbi:MAG: T9SS type A sorting domain-containing protein [Ignavibacterium sp.]|nr:T9SS type A sorting domain-containing protein [Ignavibacterium sp.]
MPETGYHFVAVQKGDNIKKLVSRHRTINGQWDSLNIIIDSCDCSNPTFQIDEYWPISLIFEDTVDGNRRLFQVMNWTSDKSVFPVEINYSGNTYSYESDIPYVVTKDGIAYQNYRFPHSYFVDENNNKRIRLSFDNFWPNWGISDTLVSVKFPLSKLSVSNLGTSFGTETIYTVWEDSSNGKIQLFGRNEFILYGSVEDESNPGSFILYQNYPNPFNPVTAIEYKILSASDVRFEVINILGERVFEENYGYQQSGNYTLNFNGENIPSGVYIYTVFAGENRLSRKMVLLR